jgi:DNA-directed RNA polymerase subunit alpha
MFQITLPQTPKIKQLSDFQAIFEIDACFPGYGLTLGNAIRRVLLSSLPGSAITAFKIEGVPHEFTTIKFIEEDVIQIMLNLKKIRFKSYTDQPITGKIAVKGNKKVLAKDLKLPSDIEVINPDELIATLTSTKAEFIAEVLIERGVGYLTAEENKLRRQLASGMINIDSIFSPIKKINVRVEDMRVGERTDFNKLIFDITTDGSISPQEAFKEAAKILIKQFEVFLLKEVDIDQKKDAQPVITESKTSLDTDKTFNLSLLKDDIKSLKLSARIVNALKANKINTIEDLIKIGEEGLLKIDGIGDKAIKEIKRRLGRIGLTLKIENV